MNEINGYWTDENNNRWDSRSFTENQAKKNSGTLINCTGCTDCRYCTDCRNCTGCRNCTYCRNCTDCRYCTDCTDCTYCRNCTDCTGCRNCAGCRYCRNCTGCTDCKDCTDCRNCTDFKTNPQRVISPKIGSREEQTTHYWNSEKELTVCGCFIGTLKELKGAVIKTHGENEHAQAYLKWIEKVETYKAY